ncbi:unnamed protein product [Soboliphyme baturini]|uniref:glucuronosyltransferase n=1 Tax=Soboliphyme baturini TaxID=241478 RepID=A0A183J9D9_9BILA|nr:unnamed protein product [Soboliphyme baturini]
MDNAVDGVILFSFGSVVNTTYMPHGMKVKFADAFRRFPNYTVIWKMDDQLPEEMRSVSNIKVFRWLPQRAILRHPKLKLCIMHGGYNSLLETVLSGVPMLLIPLFGDQHTNSQRAARLGLALVLDKMSLTAQSIADSISEVLHDYR